MCLTICKTTWFSVFVYLAAQYMYAFDDISHLLPHPHFHTHLFNEVKALCIVHPVNVGPFNTLPRGQRSPNHNNPPSTMDTFNHTHTQVFVSTSSSSSSSSLLTPPLPPLLLDPPMLLPLSHTCCTHAAQERRCAC